MEGNYVKTLFVTLRRGLAGKPHFHRSVLKSLGLRTRHQCLEKPNNESIRGMLLKVAHLVIVETDRMFYLNRMREHYHQLPREPLMTKHGSQVEASQEHQNQLMTSSPALFAPKVPSPAARLQFHPSLRDQPLPEVHPMQSVLVAPHLKEHYGAMEPQPKPEKPGHTVSKLIKKRGELVRSGYSAYHEKVQALNVAIMEAKQRQYMQEAEVRRRVIRQKQMGERKWIG